MPWRHVREKKKTIEKPGMHCWRGTSLLKDRFYRFPASALATFKHIYYVSSVLETKGNPFMFLMPRAHVGWFRFTLLCLPIVKHCKKLGMSINQPGTLYSNLPSMVGKLNTALIAQTSVIYTDKTKPPSRWLLGNSKGSQKDKTGVARAKKMFLVSLSLEVRQINCPYRFQACRFVPFIWLEAQRFQYACRHKACIDLDKMLFPV